MSRGIPWGRVVIEGAVIVLSILLAFAIDAWWDQIGEREQERLALAGLETDFEGYLAVLAADRASNQERVVAARTLINLAGPELGVVDEAVVQELLGRVILYNTILLPPGTLGSLLETDGLSLISDATLRSDLVAWTRSLEGADERNAYLIEQSRELDAFLKPRYPMAGILRRAQANVLGVSGDAGTNATDFPVRVTSLLTDQEFENHIAFAEDASVLVMQSADALVERAESILASVRQELAAGSE